MNSLINRSEEAKFLIAKNLKNRSDHDKFQRLECIWAVNNNDNSKRKELYHNGDTDRMEDYLEVIYELIQQKGYATTIDISKYLNVSSPSVTKMVQRLCETGYLNYEKYRGLGLTQKGTSVAIDIHNRHSLLTKFLKMIGVDEDVANRDAEGIEHHLHSETLKKLDEFVKLIKKKIPNL
jgi:Mn-dependent DtxR family transcriptional regulator